MIQRVGFILEQLFCLLLNQAQQIVVFSLRRLAIRQRTLALLMLKLLPKADLIKAVFIANTFTKS